MSTYVRSAPTMPTTVATGTRNPRMHGIPSTTSGSVVTRSNVMTMLLAGSAYVLAAPGHREFCAIEDRHACPVSARIGGSERGRRGRCGSCGGVVGPAEHGVQLGGGDEEPSADADGGDLAAGDGAVGGGAADAEQPGGFGDGHGGGVWGLGGQGGGGVHVVPPVVAGGV